MKMSKVESWRGSWDKFLINIWMKKWKLWQRVEKRWWWKFDGNQFSCWLSTTSRTLSHCYEREKEAERKIHHKIILHISSLSRGGRIPNNKFSCSLQFIQQFAILWLQIIYHDIMHEFASFVFCVLYILVQLWSWYMQLCLLLD
jgi:hypothetical protein